MEKIGITHRQGGGLPTMPYDKAGRPQKEETSQPEPTTAGKADQPQPVKEPKRASNSAGKADAGSESTNNQE